MFTVIAPCNTTCRIVSEITAGRAKNEVRYAVRRQSVDKFSSLVQIEEGNFLRQDCGEQLFPEADHDPFTAEIEHYILYHREESVNDEDAAHDDHSLIELFLYDLCELVMERIRGHESHRASRGHRLYNGGRESRECQSSTARYYQGY